MLFTLYPIHTINIVRFSFSRYVKNHKHCTTNFSRYILHWSLDLTSCRLSPHGQNRLKCCSVAMFKYSINPPTIPRNSNGKSVYCIFYQEMLYTLLIVILSSISIFLFLNSVEIIMGFFKFVINYKLIICLLYMYTVIHFRLPALKKYSKYMFSCCHQALIKPQF